MTPKDAPDCTRLPEVPPQGIQEWLELLRAGAARMDPATDIDHIVWGVSDAAERIVNEHTGMAEELLCVYEQLGIVFEVTRKLSTVQSESEVVDLFLDCLQRSFSNRCVLCIRPKTGLSACDAQARGGWVCQGALPSPPRGGVSGDLSPWLISLVERARDGATVLVDRVPEDARIPIAQAMTGPVFAGDSFICAIVMTRAASVAEFRASDMSLLESLTTFCGDLIRVQRLLDEMREMSVTIVRSLVSAVDQKDEYTSGHSVRVGYFATLLGKKLGLDEAALRMLQWSAFLHDVGKIGIRDEVLKKPGKLTVEEFEHIKEHPVRSYQVVREVPQLKDALDGVLYHHEHFDGSGYPEGLTGQRIPLQARIIQIADIFDALTTTRSYRAEYDWRRALEILAEEAGKTVDAALLEVFATMIRNLLEDDPGAWDSLIRRAERFTSISDLTEDDGKE